MLDELKNLFKDGLQYTHTSAVLQQLGNLINIFQDQFMKNSDAKNTAIDLICEILKSHKDPVQKEMTASEILQDAVR